MAAPPTIRDAERSPVNLTPILSRMMPAKMRKKQNTLRKYSDAAYVPKTDEFQPLVDSIIVLRGDMTSTNI